MTTRSLYFIKMVEDFYLYLSACIKWVNVFALDIGKAAVSRAIDSLEIKEYVTRIRQLEDRRAYRVSLTEKALSVGKDIKDIYEKLYQHVRKDITDEEFHHIEALLTRVVANIQSLEDE